MAGDWKGVTAPLECMENSNKSHEDCMSILDGEQTEIPTKNKKVSDNSCEGGGGVVQNNCTLIEIISSAGVSIGDASRKASVVEEDGKCLKEEEEQLPFLIAH